MKTLHQEIMREAAICSRMCNNGPRMFECGIRDTDGETTVVALSRGKAKSQFLRELEWDGVKFTDIRCRDAGKVCDTESFKRTAKYRGVPHLHMGMWVTACSGRHAGWIVGSNPSANFDIMDENGRIVNIHPVELDGQTLH